MMDLNILNKRLLEHVNIFTPLGIRFWDPVQDIQVNDGLRVTAHSEMNPRLSIEADQTASGVYAFHDLPGRRDVRFGNSDRFPTSSPPYANNLFIKVQDGLNRFMPVVFKMDFSLLHNGIFSPTIQSSPQAGSNDRFYLFSAPTRSVSPGVASVRGQLFDNTFQIPASYAIIEVYIQGHKWYGLTDERGCFTLLFPYPTLVNTFGISPPVLAQSPLHRQHWELTVRVRYVSTPLDYPPGLKIRYLESIWKQHLAIIYPTLIGSPPDPITELKTFLNYGQELILRTEKEEKSRFLIESIVSPP